MEPNKDFKELLVLFNANHVEFVIVGAYALAFHGAPRFTGDLDLQSLQTLVTLSEFCGLWMRLDLAVLNLQPRIFLMMTESFSSESLQCVSTS